MNLVSLPIDGGADAPGAPGVLVHPAVSQVTTSGGSRGVLKYLQTFTQINYVHKNIQNIDDDDNGEE